MRDALNRVHRGTRKVIRWIHLPLVASPMMRYHIAPVNNRIPQCFVSVIYADFRPNAPTLAFSASRCHLLEARKIVLNGAITPRRSNPMHSFLPHLGLFSVICVSIAVLDQLGRQLVELIEMV